MPDDVYIAFDPGKTTGVAAYNEEGKINWLMPVLYNTLPNFLFQKQDTIKTAIIEEFKLFPHKAQQQVFQDMWAPRAIGVIHAWCTLNNIRQVFQMSSNLDIGYKWLKQKRPPRSNVSHALDAHAHGTFYLVKHNILDASKL